ncbi:helix-turn-helix transcriptional regulator [Pararhodonellum marinum]|uniref:helix-turn-helix transcriptional regulator n=1 Tax=Pararhodonellum marinum TaxID=2755358 RepID=UPI00188F0119|nr:WYL domain-containing protein [Pararhodonellum marinum]
MPPNSSIEQQKILRVFKLINLLRGNMGKTVRKLSELLETDERTVYRYFKLLEALGFQVVKEHGKFKIEDRVEIPTNSFDGTFTEEETQYLARLLGKGSRKNKLRETIMQKIHIRSDFQRGVEQLFDAHLGILVDKLALAIKNNLQTTLIDYYAISSDSVSDRLVEPVAFTKDYDSIFAFEVQSGEMKTFKLDRIGEVALSTQTHQHSKLHRLPQEGLFGYSGEARFPVKLKLSKKAYQLLIEEHPAAKPFTYISNRNQYFFETAVPQLPGIARFVLGLPGEIQVLEGEELVRYLQSQRERAG